MFHNDSSVFTKYWAEIWWNPQNTTSQGTRRLQEIIIRERELRRPRCLRSLTWLMAFPFALLNSQKSYALNAALQNPERSPLPAFLKHICISSEKQNSQSFQATSALLGSYKNWQVRETKIPLSPPSTLTQEVTRKVCSDCPATLTTIGQGKTTLGIRQLGSPACSLWPYPRIASPRCGKPDSRTLQRERFWHC